MRTEPIQLIGSAYADKVRPWSSQDVCNWIPTQAEVPGTRTPQRYATAPGLRPYLEIPESEFSGTVVRGMWNCNNKLFAVIGTQLYQISNTGVAIPRGTIPGVQRVKFAHNWINEGNELLIVNGYSGYVYSTVTQELKKVVDAGYPGAIDVVFIDNYLVQIEPARRFAFNSALADASNYNELDRFTSEVNSDLLVGMAVTNNELLLFSEKSSEFFYNSGDQVQPFKSKRIYMNRGCAGRDTINLTDNTVFWLGDDGCFYRLDGYSPVRISTRPVEEAIRGLNWAQAFSFVWNDSGHSVVYWTFPDGHTWGYDASTQKWHRRASRGMRRWRVNCMATWQDRWFAGDFQAKRLWEVDWDYYMEGDQEIERECTSPVTHDNQCRVLMPRLEVIMDVGNESVAQGQFPEQPTGPAISGDAPNGTTGVPYSYTYTVTAGSSPIAKTTIDESALLAGFTWNQSTATLGGTPAESGSMTIRPRVVDRNGLWAQIEDTISTIGIVYWAPETATGGALDILDGGVTVSGASNTAGSITADTVVSDGDWYWESTTGWYLDSSSEINHFGQTGIIRISDSANGLVLAQIGASDGGAVASDNTLFSSQILYPGWIPAAGISRQARVRNRLSFNGSGATWKVAIDDGDWAEIMTDKIGEFAPYARSRGSNEDGVIPAKRATIYSRPSEFLYEVPAGAMALGMAVTA